DGQENCGRPKSVSDNEAALLSLTSRSNQGEAMWNHAASAAVLVVSLAFTPASAAAPDERFSDFDAYVQTAMADFKVPGLSVAIVQDGKLILARGYGVCREGKDRTVDAETV